MQSIGVDSEMSTWRLALARRQVLLIVGLSQPGTASAHVRILEPRGSRCLVADTTTLIACTTHIEF
jgi:hypothetical protein